MSIWFALLLFFSSLFLSLISSIVLTNGLERVGSKLHFSEGLFGIVTALGADAPEISSAVTALISGQHDLGLGVVFGSNIFNLAALIGLSALIAGKLQVKWQNLVFNGVVSFLVTVVAILLIFNFVPPLISFVLILGLLIPYIILSILPIARLEQYIGFEPLRDFLYQAKVSEGEREREAVRQELSHSEKPDTDNSQKSLIHFLVILPALILIILASVGMVNSAVTLSTAWQIPHVITGTFILAILTGLPNVVAAVRLARVGRSRAVFSEAFNSNTFNLISGVCLPAILLGLMKVSSQTAFTIWWLLGMTVATLGLASWPGGLNRARGILILVLYLIFIWMVLSGWAT